MRKKLMQAVADLIYKYYWIVLVASVAMTVFMYFSSKQLVLKLNFTDMLSQDAPAVKMFRHAARQFGALSFLFIVLEVDDPSELDRAKAYADELARRLPENQDFVPRVFHKVEIEDYLDDALLFLGPRELDMLAELVEKNKERIEDMVGEPGLASAVEGVNAILSSYTRSGEIPDLPEETDFGLVFDPLIELVGSFEDYALNGPGDQAARLKKSFLSRTLEGGEELPIDLSEPYVISSDGRRLLIFVSSTRPAEDFEWCTEFMEYVDGVDEEVGRKYPGVKSQKTGNAAFMRDDNKILREDMTRTTLVAFVCIMALFAFSFRNLSSILMVGVPLATGILWSLGAAYWVVGHLTPITAIFGAILLGLGIDYAILILSRYTEERHRGRAIKEALDITMTETGVSIVTGAAATAAAFFSMMLATFKGGQETGLIAGTGIILFVIIMTFGLGSLLVAWDRARESIGPTQREFNPRIMRVMASLVDRGAVYVLVVLGAGLAYLAFRAPGIEFEYNYLNLEPEHVESFELVHKIPEWFNIDVNYGMIISKTVEDDRRLAATLREQKKTVSRVDAISDFIPPDQEQKLEIIARIGKAIEAISAGGPEGDAAAMTEAGFERLMEALRSLRDTVGAPGRGLVGLFYVAELEDAEDGARALLADLDKLIASLEENKGPELYKNLGDLDHRTELGVQSGWKRLSAMTDTKGVSIETLAEKHPELLDRFRGRDGSFLIYAYPSMTIWEEQNLKAVADGLRDVDENAMGVAILFDEILRQIKSDLWRIALLALSMVFLVLFINYRGLWHTLLTLIPLVAGGVAMVGMMNVRGLKFNIINTGMLPLVIGIGVDYGVYVVHRWMGEGKGLDSIRPTVLSTGRAVTLSAFTTMIGFSAIILAQWRGLSLMGSTLAMGIGMCWVAAVIFLPAILKLIEVFKARRKPNKS
jgi:predicted RND superfamily exporter protein